MKKTLALVLTLALAFAAMFTLVSCDKTCKHVDENGDFKCDKCEFPMEGDITVDDSLLGTYDITMWVSELVKKDEAGNEVDSVVKMTQRQIDAFEAANPGITINASIEGVTEADAGSKVVADVATAPDIYCFAQDQLARLVQASALSAPGKKAQEYINTVNDQGAVNAAKVAGTIYAYPMTSDNGYYLYYDTSIVKNPESLEDIIADCERAGKKFRYALENAWYTASFFFATGCVSNWTMNEKGQFTSVEDTLNSPEGLVAMKGMQKLAQSTAYDSNADSFDECAAIVTGVWNSQTAALHFGNNLGATDLPSFTVDGKEYHLGSYGGNKLMGIKPQTDAKKGAVLQLLAQYLTSDACQMERFEVFGWGPSSRISQANEKVLADVSLAALAKQSAYSQPQGQIHGSWWDIAKVLGAEAKAAQSEADLQQALTDYRAAIDALFQMSPEQMRAWSVIGSLCGTNWDTDLAMTEDPANTWTSEELTLNAGDQFKVRQGASWTLSFGFAAISDAAAEYIESSSDGNCVVKVAGTYKVQFVFDEAAQTGVINLIVAE
ncbi:MAG: extracellular solute-binding protein [Clostridia bacterium]|nr:extracellular solute-binding protein [Clostridia bacterium]